jgi:diaminopimelate decarboxylase
MSMRKNLPATEIAEIFRSAVARGLTEGHDLIMFHDLDFLRERFDYLRECFPPQTLHAVAMKANPLTKLLRLLQGLGAATEAASMGELQLAEHAGYPPEKIVFDSPVKTVRELEYAIRAGVHINIDSLAELERIRVIRERVKGTGTFGLRINPQTGTGTIATSSVAGNYSKFGVPITERRNEIISAYLKNDWLTGVHLHIGSQGCAPEMLVNGAKTVYDLVKEINLRKGHQQINIFDLGGGFPISYHHEKEAFSIREYSENLKKEIPELFSDQYTIITEFGRWLHVNAGWTVSRVEYVKNDGGIRTTMLHAGADLFLRECLLPADWKHEYTVLDPSGNIRESDLSPCNLAGPLCFSGDMLAKDVVLPRTEEGDYLVIHDTGGYTLGMWSRYNSRFMPMVLGYHQHQFEILKQKESFGELQRFWE